MTTNYTNAKIKAFLFVSYFNSFVPNALFLFPLKTPENRKVFWCFQGIEKGRVGNELVNMQPVKKKFMDRTQTFHYLWNFQTDLDNIKKRNRFLKNGRDQNRELLGKQRNKCESVSWKVKERLFGQWLMMIKVSGKQSSFFYHNMCCLIEESYSYIVRSSHNRCSIKKGVLKNFAKFTGKHLLQSLFFSKVEASDLQLC